MDEAQAGDCRRRKGGKADKQVDTDGTMRIERENGNEQWQTELGPAQTDQAGEQGDGGSGGERSERSANRVVAVTGVNVAQGWCSLDGAAKRGSKSHLDARSNTARRMATRPRSP